VGVERNWMDIAVVVGEGFRGVLAGSGSLFSRS
jgi:hypothetical protein